MGTRGLFRKMRGLTASAFLLEGIVAAAFIAMMAFGDRRMTPLDGFVLSALLLGFVSALGSILIASPERERIVVHVTPPPERRRLDRRVLDLGSPTGIERRSGRSRRVADLTLGGIVGPYSVLAHCETRAR
jgi:hypothetical protein